ncbi:Serine/threonine protein kinase [Saccharopolyspora antimicrobica]|uniref:non-specific serine/threonine protein kinase n=2 Tax=Saccharopolyspora antimicrobica TaxID=455193 RepID=A0A1I4Y7L7_9PSEU|nr:serine/threonine protein kinase [Saccharopolyspora antimicrobica]SFN34066.1 Serine/threonine protein kinase [Saccharopolyspora antimicrobica]
MGVLLGGEFVLSCAHVVGERDEVRVAFSFGEPGEFRARPTEFVGSAEDGSRDIALLRLVEPFPTSWSAPLAAPAELPPRARVRCHGHSGNYPDGMWINLRVDGPAGPGGRLVQLSTSSFCRNVERGFSGAAVLDGQSGAVLGIVVQKAADQHAQGVAWMIPVGTIFDRLPELRSAAAENPPVRSPSVRFGQLAAQIGELRDAEDEVARLRWLLFRDTSTVTLPQRNYNASRIALAGFRGREEENPGSVPVEELDAFERELADALDLVVAERRRLEEIGARSPGSVPAGTPCRRLDCQGRGSIDETGYCDTCARRPVTEGPVPDGEETWNCAGIVPLPVLRFPKDTGESSPGTPRLRPGTRVGAKKYEIRRFLAKGGFGRIYLAHDPGLQRKVVLKASIDQDEQAARILRAEAWHLTRLTHDNLLSAHDFFQHPVDGEPVDFIAMDYVEGVALTEVAKLPRGPRDSPLLAEILAYGCEILAAIEYLHRQDLYYTDMKPANVMRSSRGIVIVDLAGVWDPRRANEKPQLTRTFYPEQEFRTTGRPSVGTDLYAVARTLTELIRPLPGSDGGMDSAQRVLDRALGLDTSRRFSSAAEMADQLRRVVREIMALHGFEQPLEPSYHFEPVTSDLDHGLGVVPPLESWWRSGAELVGFGLPSPQKIARELPAPRVDPRDRNAANLSRVTGSDFRRLTTMLPDSVESRLKACRMALAQGDRPDVAGARESLDAAQAQRHSDEVQGKQTPGPAWRLDWHEGLVALAAGEIGTALRHFTEVRAILPGEAIPKVALGLCHEHLGEGATGKEAKTAFKVARSCYLAVWQRDRAPAGAAFGLARLFLRAGRRDAAAKVLDEVPAVSRQYDAARIAAIRVHLLWLGGTDWPSVADVRTAARRAEEVLRADSELRRYDADTRDRLVAWLQRSALALVERSGGTVRFPAQVEPHEKELFGDPLTERGIRRRLERSLEALASQARRRSPAELSALLDRKNELRPMTWW